MPRWLQSLLDLLSRLFGDKPQPSPPKPDPPTPDPPDADQVAKDLLAAHNKERSSRGVPKLRLHDQLLQAAKQHAQWMYDNNAMSHTGANMSSVGTRVRNAGYRAMSVGENIARGYRTVEAVMNGWMNSSGHRSNILRQSYVDCGFARVGDFWCAVFASPVMIRDSKDRLGFEDYEPQESCPEPLDAF